MEDQAGVRLQKVLARAGLGSRRACEALIAAGRVEVDGRVVTEQGIRVDEHTSVVRVDGQRIATAPHLVYLVLNKPRGVVSTMADERGRPSLGDLVGDRPERLFHVGRLDTDTEGLLVLTNDGEFAHRLAHPSYEVSKTYLAEVPDPLPPGALSRLRAGVTLHDGPAAVDSVRVIGKASGRLLLEVVIHEGRNRIVRRMLDAVGCPVRRLVRTRIGPVRLGSLAPGHVRPLTQRELGELFASVGL